MATPPSARFSQTIGNNGANTTSTPVQDEKVSNNHLNGSGANRSDVSFGEFITFELSSYQNNFFKDKAKQEIVNVIYKFKNQAIN